jgi:hypothetical protein
MVSLTTHIDYHEVSQGTYELVEVRNEVPQKGLHMTTASIPLGHPMDGRGSHTQQLLISIQVIPADCSE